MQLILLPLLLTLLFNDRYVHAVPDSQGFETFTTTRGGTVRFDYRLYVRLGQRIYVVRVTHS